MKNLFRKFKPIKVFSIQFAYGYWWGKRVYFIGKHCTAFAIIPLSYMVTAGIEYASNNHIVGHGDIDSWSLNRKREEAEPK